MADQSPNDPSDPCDPPGSSDLPDPDVALMIAASRGSDEAFTELVLRHQRPLLNFFVRMGASTDSEDLVQETFIRVFRYRERYLPTARFATFLYHLARNVWADRGRKAMRTERLESALREEISQNLQGIHKPPGRSMDVQAALDHLSPKLRDAIVLNIYQGLRYHEVAAVLDIPLGTVKSRINLAIAALKDYLHEK